MFFKCGVFKLMIIVDGMMCFVELFLCVDVLIIKGWCVDIFGNVEFCGMVL